MGGFAPPIVSCHFSRCFGVARPVGVGRRLAPLPVAVGSSLLIMRPVRGDQVVVVDGSSTTVPLYAGRVASAL